MNVYSYLTLYQYKVSRLSWMSETSWHMAEKALHIVKSGYVTSLPLLGDLLSPPRSPSSSKTPATPHHPLLSTDEAWEICYVLPLWLSLLLTVPFNLFAILCNITPELALSISLRTNAYPLYPLPPSSCLTNVLICRYALSNHIQ